MVFGILFCFLFASFPLNLAQLRVPWIRKNGQEDLDTSPFETVLSRLFGFTDNLYGIDNAVDTISDEERLKVRDEFDVVASKANEFLEQMISFLDGNNERSKGDFKGEFGKGRSTYDKKTLTLGQHVCVREKKISLPQEGSGSVCTLFKRATRCVSGDANGTLIRIVECCEGHQTEDIKKGCTPYENPSTLEDLLVGKNACINVLDLKDIQHSTLLIPANETCSADDIVDRDWDQYILDQPYRSYELLNSQKLSTRKPDTFVIVTANTKQTDSSNDKPLLNCVKIADEDLKWEKGIVQVLSSPLSLSTQTLLDIITNSSDFTAFSELLTDELRELLASKDRVSTVFVFTDTIFSSLSPSLRARMRQRKGCAKDLIKEHVYDGMLCSALMEGDAKSITGTKHRFYKQHDGNETEIIHLDNGRIADTDQVALNGVLHRIDDVIFSENFVDWRDHLELPERDFLDLVERNIGYEDEPVAIFVPPSNYFQNVTDEKSFVLNHITMGDSHVTNKLVKTAYGSKIPSWMNSPRPTFGCAKTLKPPMKYCNTTIYLIDSPLPVIENTLAEVIAHRDNFSMFASLLNDSSIDLNSDGPYTVFLPSNDALSRNHIKALKANKTLANDFVKRHVFEGLICSKNLHGKRSLQLPAVLRNVRGEYYDGKTESEKTTLSGIDLEEVDQLATNGIVHTLESPLQWQPQSRHRSFCSFFDFI